MASKKGQGEPRSGSEESFEDVYHRLEETVAKLEEGGLTLEQAIALYEEGMKLAQRCQAMLEGAELRVARLQEAFAA
ncbi:MAG: exodeoxyribonuclease VII small subunit, partial [Dehalococcoidia bacterium]